MEDTITFWIGQESHPFFYCSFSIHGLLIIVIVYSLVSIAETVLRNYFKSKKQ